MRRLIHQAIQWYLRRSGGAFHTNPYGPSGRYVVLMNEEDYHQFRQVQSQVPRSRPGLTDLEALVPGQA